MLMLVSPLQPQNASELMEVTELGMSILVSPQLENANLPIEVTELGISMLVKPLQPENAEEPMVVTELGMVVFLQPKISLLPVVSMIALQLLRES